MLSVNLCPNEQITYASMVANFEPEKEYEETLNKGRGLLEAIRCLR
jgi:anthranilate/para-aminobenzoate synthase component I